MLLFIVINSFLSVFVNAEGGVSKRWVKTWDLDDRSNWEERRLPCSGQKASLPSHPTNPIFLGDRLTMGILELPEGGELIFGDEANLVLDDRSLGNCQDTKWNHHGYDSWWDPEAWSYQHFEDPATSPVPHVHRVPCTRDEAVFTHPNQSVYSVHLSSPAISISTLKIGDKEYSTSEFAAYAGTGEGSFRFVGVSSKEDSAPLYIETPRECSDITGCLCHTAETLPKICSIMEKKCLSTNCANPIKMTGFCCKVCGAEMIAAHNGSLSLENVGKLLKEHLSSPEARDVKAYVSKMQDNLFHIYFTAANENGNFKAASVAFRMKFQSELGAGGHHATLLAYSGTMDITPRKGPSANSIAASFITLAVCLAIGLAVFYLRKRRITSELSFMFRRLESSSRRVSVVSDMGGRRPSTSSSVFVPSYSREGGLRFLNPIFNQSLASLVGEESREKPTSSVISSEGQPDGQHENPMYIAYESMSLEERQASEDTLRARQEMLHSNSDLSITQAKIDMIQQSFVKPQLDAIAEEKPKNTDTGHDNAKEKMGETDLVPDLTPYGLTDESHAMKTSDEQSSPGSEGTPSSNMNVIRTEEIDAFLDIFASDSKEASEVATSVKSTSISPEKETDENAISDNNSVSSSSNSSNNIHMNIEGFVPRQDTRLEK